MAAPPVKDVTGSPRRVSQLSAAFSASERTLSSVSWDMDAHALQQSLSSLVPSEAENCTFFCEMGHVRACTQDLIRIFVLSENENVHFLL